MLCRLVVSPVVRVNLSWLVKPSRRGFLTVEFLLKHLSSGMGGKPLPAFVIFQLLTAQNNQYTKVTYFGVHVSLQWTYDDLSPPVPEERPGTECYCPVGNTAPLSSQLWRSEPAFSELQGWSEIIRAMANLVSLSCDGHHAKGSHVALI